MTKKPCQFIKVDADMNCLSCGQSCRNVPVRPLNEVPASAAEDKIRHPKHYTQGIECWDYITSHKMGYLEGNIIKYITRYKDKGGAEDLLKARAYLDRLIEETEKEGKTI